MPRRRSTREQWRYAFRYPHITFMAACIRVGKGRKCMAPDWDAYLRHMPGAAHADVQG